MLQVGSSKLSDDEARTHFAAWCVTSAPLILGFNLADTAASARAENIVGNVVAIGEKGPPVRVANPWFCQTFCAQNEGQ